MSKTLAQMISITLTCSLKSGRGLPHSPASAGLARPPRDLARALASWSAPVRWRFSQSRKNASCLGTSALLCLFIAGCASPNVNPATAHSHTGYVDLVADEPDLCWQVDRLGPDAKPKPVFVQYSPLNDHILRLALAPGRYQLRVTYLNRVVREPGIVDVEVKDGTIAPLRVKFAEMGTTLVETKSTQASGTFYGRFGRATKLADDEAIVYRVNLERDEAVPYRMKSEMPYAKASAQK